MNRAQQPGWVLAAMNDPAGRRGIWYREVRDPRDARRLVALEVCGGREGDDCYARLEAGAPLDGAALMQLCHALETGAWMVRDYHRPPRAADDDEPA